MSDPAPSPQKILEPCRGRQGHCFDQALVPTFASVEQNVLSLRNGKACGQDGMTAELLQLHFAISARALLPVFVKWILGIQEPLEFREVSRGALSMPLGKKAAAAFTCSKFRAICCRVSRASSCTNTFARVFFALSNPTPSPRTSLAQCRRSVQPSPKPKTSLGQPNASQDSVVAAFCVLPSAPCGVLTPKRPYCDGVLQLFCFCKAFPPPTPRTTLRRCPRVVLLCRALSPTNTQNEPTTLS